MIRFIDLRGQIIDLSDEENAPIRELPREQCQPHFAFFDTVRDEFVKLNGFQEWRTRIEFERDFVIDGSWRDAERFIAKLPGWVPGSSSADTPVTVLLPEESTCFCARELFVKVERLQHRIDAAVLRLSAEANRHDRMRDYVREAWLRDIVSDLSK